MNHGGSQWTTERQQPATHGVTSGDGPRTEQPRTDQPRTTDRSATDRPTVWHALSVWRRALGRSLLSVMPLGEPTTDRSRQPETTRRNQEELINCTDVPRRRLSHGVPNSVRSGKAVRGPSCTKQCTEGKAVGVHGVYGVGCLWAVYAGVHGVYGVGSLWYNAGVHGVYGVGSLWCTAGVQRLGYACLVFS